jgi:hypothetical protein
VIALAMPVAPKQKPPLPFGVPYNASSFEKSRLISVLSVPGFVEIPLNAAVLVIHEQKSPMGQARFGSAASSQPMPDRSS